MSYTGPLGFEGSIVLNQYPRRGIRVRIMLAGMLAAFIVGLYAGAYYNAYRQIDAVLPVDASVVRDLGYVEPVDYRLEVGML